jgi:hypothetical protein
MLEGVRRRALARLATIREYLDLRDAFRLRDARQI